MDKGKQPEPLTPPSSTPSSTQSYTESGAGRWPSMITGALRDELTLENPGPATYGDQRHATTTQSETIHDYTQLAKMDAPNCPISTLPLELIDAILSHLSEIDLASVCQTCRALNARATSDYLWQALVQDHVPGIKVTTPYPCATFRDLWAAHDSRWFLPKYKIWFSGHDLMGKVIIARYDQRRGCIEGYQLLAISNRTGIEHWQADEQVIIHTFEPTVKLHLDKPVLHLRCDQRSSPDPFPEDGEIQTLRYYPGGRDNGTVAVLSLGRPKHEAPAPSASSSNGSSSEGSASTRPSRFAEEIPMTYGASVDQRMDGMFSNFMLSRPLSEQEAEAGLRQSFPYGDVWPPPSIPAPHRVAAANFRRNSNHLHISHRTHLVRPAGSTAKHSPRCRGEISDRSFRIRRWMQMRPYPALVRNSIPPTPQPSSVVTAPAPAPQLYPQLVPNTGITAAAPQAHHNQATPLPLFPNKESSVVSLHMGEEITTYATLDPELYTPTADYPWRGIWVGDYSGHGCEFLLINQKPHPPGYYGDGGGEPPFDESSFTQEENETDEAFEARKRDARIYRGRLEAIKLTGDPNVPRGEYTFIVDDLGPRGFVSVVQEPPFKGARMVKSRGHVAGSGFTNDKFIDSQLLLISPNRLAQYWLGFGHISFFERVDIDKFLIPQ